MYSKPRTRLVAFRISEDEFESLSKAVVARGGRSLSDYVRDTVLTALANPELSGTGLQVRLGELDGRLAALEGRVEGFEKEFKQAREAGWQS